MMRLNSLLFVALHFACFHTSSTRSMSTSGNITEERMVNMPTLIESAEGISKTLPEAEEKMMKLSPVRFKYRTDFTMSSRLHNYKITQKLLKSWISVLRQDRERIEEATKELLTRIEHGSDGTIIDTLRAADVDEKTWNMVGDVMIEHWKKGKKTPLYVFKLLRLDNMKSRYTPIGDTPTQMERFKIWTKFATEITGSSILDVSKDFDFAYRLIILDGLRLTKDTQNVKSMEAALIKAIPQLNGEFRHDIANAFFYLVLHKDVKNLLTHRNIELFNEFVTMAFPGISKVEALITGYRKVSIDRRIGKMLFDRVNKGKDAEAKPLLEELFRQWKNDVEWHRINIDDVAEGEVNKAYYAYVSPRVHHFNLLKWLNKRADA